MYRFRTIVTASAFAAMVWFVASPSMAEEPESSGEPAWVVVEGYAALPMSEPHDALFGRGGGAAIGIYKSLVPEIALGVRLGTVILSEENRPEGALGVGMLSGALRLRPFAKLWPERRATGLWFEAGVGGAMLEDRFRLAFEAGIGLNFPAGSVAFGPMARLIRVRETETRFAGSSRDVYIALFGLEIAINDHVEDPTVDDLPPRPQAY